METRAVHRLQGAHVRRRPNRDKGEAEVEEQEPEEAVDDASIRLPGVFFHLLTRFAF